MAREANQNAGGRLALRGIEDMSGNAHGQALRSPVIPQPFFQTDADNLALLFGSGL